MRIIICSLFVMAVAAMDIHSARAELGDVLLRLDAPDAGLHFGTAVDISGSTLVVGTGSKWPGEEPESAESVYVYDQANGGQLIHALKSETSVEGDWFGASVAVHENLAIIGSPFADSAGTDSGAAYLFDVTTGAELFKFVPDDVEMGSHLGVDVAIHGNRAIVSSSEQRAAYVYDTATDDLVHKLTAAGNLGFGSSVAMDSDVIIVGGTSSSGAGLGGSVHAFDALTGDRLWQFVSDESADHLGFSVDVSGNTTIVGAPYARREVKTDAGAVHLFNSYTGEHQRELQPISPALGRNFGETVAIDGGRALVGVSNERRGSLFGGELSAPGAVYAYDVATADLLLQLLGDNLDGDIREFGTSVGMSGTNAIVGSANNDLAFLLDMSGAAVPPEIIEPPIRETPGVVQPGDAERDLDFDQFDIIHAFVAGNKYDTDEPATWEEGDWNGAPGGSADEPPKGDGVFDRWDLTPALNTALYLTGPYGEGGREGRTSLPIGCCGNENDDQTSIIYDSETGELSFDAPVGRELNAINVDSVSGIFTGAPKRNPISSLDIDKDHTIFSANFDGPIKAGSIGKVAQSGLSQEFLLEDLSATGSLVGGGEIGIVDLIYLGASTLLMAGDANQDLEFDQFDIVQVVQAEKYLTGLPATWGEGDWNGAPGGSPGDPPLGDGLFNQLDIIAALDGGVYLTGSYAALAADGQAGDGQTSIVYDAATGQVSVDAPVGFELTSINLQSASGIFTAGPAENLGDAFDNDSDDNIFKATFGGSFGSLSFGNVAEAGLSRTFLLDDLTVQGSLAGGGSLGEVDLIYVPEPSGFALVVFGFLAITRCQRRTRRVPLASQWNRRHNQVPEVQHNPSRWREPPDELENKKIRSEGPTQRFCAGPPDL